MILSVLRLLPSSNVRIEPGKHAVDCGLDQLSVVRFLNIIGAHPFEHIAKQAELTICVGSRVLRACASIQQKAGLGCDQRHGYACRRGEAPCAMCAKCFG